MRVRLPHRRDAVRDQDHGAAPHHLGKAVQNALLGQRVHARKRVVQNQNARVAQKRAGNGGALLLSAGKRDPALANHGLITVGEGFDIARQAGQLGGPPDFVFGRVLHPESDVLRDRSAEQKRLLRNEADVAPQLRGIEFAQIDSVQQHRARGRIHQARHQTDQRALSAAGVPHHGDRRARGNEQIDTVERRARWDSPAKRRETRFRRARRQSGRASGRRGDGGPLAQDLVDAAQARRCRAASGSPPSPARSWATPACPCRC